MTSPRIRTMSTRTTAGPIGATGSERALWHIAPGVQVVQVRPRPLRPQARLKEFERMGKVLPGNYQATVPNRAIFHLTPQRPTREWSLDQLGRLAGNGRSGKSPSPLQAVQTGAIVRSTPRPTEQRKEDWVQYCKGGARRLQTPNPRIFQPTRLESSKRGLDRLGRLAGNSRGGDPCPSLLTIRKCARFCATAWAARREEWTRYCTDGTRGCCKKPDNIPASPAHVYRDDGWSGWGDWLGTGHVATRLRRYLPFAKAREFVRRLGLRNREESARTPRIWHAVVPRNLTTFRQGPLGCTGTPGGGAGLTGSEKAHHREEVNHEQDLPFSILRSCVFGLA